MCPNKYYVFSCSIFIYEVFFAVHLYFLYLGFYLYNRQGSYQTPRDANSFGQKEKKKKIYEVLIRREKLKILIEFLRSDLRV